MQEACVWLKRELAAKDGVSCHKGELHVNLAAVLQLDFVPAGAGGQAGNVRELLRRQQRTDGPWGPEALQALTGAACWQTCPQRPRHRS